MASAPEYAAEPGEYFHTSGKSKRRATIHRTSVFDITQTRTVRSHPPRAIKGRDGGRWVGNLEHQLLVVCPVESIEEITPTTTRHTRGARRRLPPDVVTEVFASNATIHDDDLRELGTCRPRQVAKNHITHVFNQNNRTIVRSLYLKRWIHRQRASNGRTFPSREVVGSSPVRFTT